MDLMNYVFVVLIAIFLLWRLLPYYRSRQMRGRTAPDFSGLLSDRQKTSSRLLLYFWSPQCVMCKGMSKIVDELADTHDKDWLKDAVGFPYIEIAGGHLDDGTTSIYRRA